MKKTRFFLNRYHRPLLPLALAVVSLTGCALAQQNANEGEEFVSGNSYAYSVPGNEAATCEAARRALLSQGYIVTDAKPTQVKGVKNFQKGKDAHTEIEFTIVCALDAEGSNSTTAFANAVRQTFSLRKSKNSASVGVGVLGSLSVPFGASDEALVKVGAETIESKIFYDQFFARLESYLDPTALDKITREQPEPILPPVP